MFYTVSKCFEQKPSLERDEDIKRDEIMLYKQSIYLPCLYSAGYIDIFHSARYSSTLLLFQGHVESDAAGAGRQSTLKTHPWASTLGVI